MRTSPRCSQWTRRGAWRATSPSCRFAAARQQAGEESNGEQCHRPDALHRLADALIEHADAFATSCEDARRLRLSRPREEGAWRGSARRAA